MFIVKLAVGVCLIFACLKVSKLKAKKIKEELLYYTSASVSCDALLNGLSYSKATVFELLNVDYPSEKFALTVRSYLNGDNLYFPDFLSGEEKITLSSYFSSLGKTDSKTQKNAILSYKNTFVNLENDKKKKYDKSYFAILKVGFSFGVMLFILVI